MKYKCIEKVNWSRKYGFKTIGFIFKKKIPIYVNGPADGDVVTKVGDQWDQGKLYYHFMEWPNMGGYDSKHFKPLAEEKEEEKMQEVTFEKITKEIPISVN